MKYKTKKGISQVKENFDHYMRSVKKQLEKSDDHDCHLSSDDGCEICERRYL